MQFKKFQLKHEMWQFWNRGIGKCQGVANDPRTGGNKVVEGSPQPPP